MKFIINLIHRTLTYPDRWLRAKTGFICYRCNGVGGCRDCG